MLCGCSNDSTAIDESYEPDSVKARRTVLVYMVAQNSLVLNARHDSAEIMAGRGYIPNNDRLLFFVDDEKTPRLYRVVKSKAAPILVKQWQNDFCSTNPDHFREVLHMVKRQFPASEYALTLWSHADGWIPASNKDYASFEGKMSPSSFGIDSGPEGHCTDRGAQMNINDMVSAMQEADWYSKFIFFDCCLMQNFEVLYALRHVADYIVGSPMQIPGEGAFYTNQIRNGLFADDPNAIARTYYDDVMNESLRSKYSYDETGICISCVRTDGLDALADTLRKVLPQSELNNRTSVAMNGVPYYQAYTQRYYYRPHNYDALPALKKMLLPADYEKVRAAIDNVVTCHYATRRFYIGPNYADFKTMPTDADSYRCVSMFVPQTIYTDNAEKCLYGDFNEAFRKTEWYKACGFENTGW